MRFYETGTGSTDTSFLENYLSGVCITRRELVIAWNWYTSEVICFLGAGFGSGNFIEIGKFYFSERLKTVFDLVKEVDLLDTNDVSHLELLSRPELGVTLTKINCWRLTQFNKCVFLDADTLVNTLYMV